MALLHPSSVDSVVAIGLNPISNRHWIGTGFLYGMWTGKKEGTIEYYKAFLVTNRHVVINNDEFYIRFNPVSNEAAKDFRISKINDDGTPNWTAHPNSKIDVAVFSISLPVITQAGMHFDYIKSNHHVFTKEQMVEVGISEGDGVFALGFPMGILDSDRQYVIVRKGCIARVRDLYENRKTDFLCDVQVFPGNSGGPVFIKPEVTAVTGTKSNNKSALIGIVKSYIPYQDVAVSRQTGRHRVTFEENTGLAAVEPVNHINETIQHFLDLRGLKLEE